MEKREEISEVIRGTVDLHVHTSPDIFSRKLDDTEAALQAKDSRFSGIALKNHFFPTADRARLARTKTGFKVIGSITLNKPVGGLNPYAVETALKGGARMVWMPTVHSVNTVSRPNVVAMFQEIMRPGEEGLPLLKGGDLLPVIDEILEMIRDADVALATGHVFPEKVMAVVRRAVKMGLKKIILTHPFSSIVGMSAPQVKELTALSENVYVEFTCFDCCEHVQNPLSVEQVAQYISQVGPHQTILTSDGGQTYNPYPVEMLKNLISHLLRHFSVKDLRTMLVENPSYLVS